jgi:hypothetical protein
LRNSGTASLYPEKGAQQKKLFTEFPAKKEYGRAENQQVHNGCIEHRQHNRPNDPTWLKRGEQKINQHISQTETEYRREPIPKPGRQERAVKCRDKYHVNKKFKNIKY